MSVLTIPPIMAKIKVSHPGSPIAVFQKSDGTLDAVFANTIATQQRIRKEDAALVGVYDNTMNVHKIRVLFRKISPASIPV